MNIRYLEYFVVSAEVGSFSRAADILYTTQSNISKGIQSLEKEVGAELFIRQTRGIALTPKGKHVYKYACRILENTEALKDFSGKEEQTWIYISMNHSSWMAKRFVEFYNLHEHENIHWQVMTASVKNIINRVRDYQDELGFVYITESQKASFHYTLAKNHLEFVPLAKSEAMLYLGQRHRGKQENLDKLRFVQSYQDEFARDNFWMLSDTEGKELADVDVAVVTNSDYIMEGLLRNTDLANISGNSLTREENKIGKSGIPLKTGDNHVVFGYLKREKEEFSFWTAEFVKFVERSLK